MPVWGKLFTSRGESDKNAPDETKKMHADKKLQLRRKRPKKAPIVDYKCRNRNTRGQNINCSHFRDKRRLFMKTSALCFSARGRQEAHPPFHHYQVVHFLDVRHQSPSPTKKYSVYKYSTLSMLILLVFPSGVDPKFKYFYSKFQQHHNFVVDLPVIWKVLLEP